jgi:VanZ family protein
MNTMKKWIPAFFVMTIIFLLSSIPGKAINDAGLGNNKYQLSAHFVIYFFLFFAYYKATKNAKTSLILSVLFALTDEFHQLYTPGRSCSLEDIITDSLAALAGGGILWKYWLKIPETLRNWLKA